MTGSGVLHLKPEAWSTKFRVYRQHERFAHGKMVTNIYFGGGPIM